MLLPVNALPTNQLSDHQATISQTNITRLPGRDKSPESRLWDCSHHTSRARRQPSRNTEGQNLTPIHRLWLAACQGKILWMSSSFPEEQLGPEFQTRPRDGGFSFVVVQILRPGTGSNKGANKSKLEARSFLCPKGPSHFFCGVNDKNIGTTVVNILLEINMSF